MGIGPVIDSVDACCDKCGEKSVCVFSELSPSLSEEVQAGDEMVVKTENPYLDRAVSVELVNEHGVVHVVEFYVEERDGSCVPLSTLYQEKGNTHTALSP